MKFELKSGSNDLLTPAFHFPGDERIPPEEYRECIDRGYMPTVATVTGAAEGCGLDIDSETFERWKRVLSSMDYLDNLLDESPDPHRSQMFYGQWLLFLRGSSETPTTPEYEEEGLKTSISLLKNSIDPLPASQQETLLESAAEIGRLAQEKAKCLYTGEYAKLLAKEGRLTACLLTDTVSDQVYLQPEFRDFEDWITYTTIWANIIFSSRDLKGDARIGTTGVEYSLRNMAKIALFSGRLAVGAVGKKPRRRASLSSCKARLTYGARFKK